MKSFALIAWLIAGAVLPAGALAVSPPVVRSTDYNGAYSNIVHFPFQPWMNPPTADLTVEAWIYPRKLSGLQAVVARGQSTNLWFGLSANRLRFARSGGSWVESAGTVPPWRWTHVAVAYDGVAAQFYINGTAAGAAALAHAGNTSTNGLSLGGQRELLTAADLFGFGYPFDGFLDEVRLWSRARWPHEMAAAMNREVREEAGLLAVFPEGGAWNALANEAGTTAGIPVTDRLSGFGLLPARLCVPSVNKDLRLDGGVDLINEYRGAEVTVLRSKHSTTEFDLPAYLMVARGPTDSHLYIGIPNLPQGAFPQDAGLQILGNVNLIKGPEGLLGNWELRRRQSGLQGGTVIGVNPPLQPWPEPLSWPQSPATWQVAVRAGFPEFFQDHEVRIHARHCNDFARPIGLLLRYHDYEPGGDEFSAPREGVPTDWETFLVTDWCGEAGQDLGEVTALVRVVDAATGAMVPGIGVGMYAGDEERTGQLLASRVTDSEGRAEFVRVPVPPDRRVTLAYSPPAGVALLPPQQTSSLGQPPFATNSPLSVTFSACPGRCSLRHLDFRFRSPQPITLGGVDPAVRPAVVMVRTDPYKTTPTNVFLLSGRNLHGGLKVFLQDANCATDPPDLCTLPPTGRPSLFVPAPIREVTEDGMLLIAEVPAGLEGVAATSRPFRVVVEDPAWAAAGGRRWNYGPYLTITPPLWAELHGFEFQNADDGPSIEEFEASYGESIFTYTPIPVRNPYYALWAAVYLYWMGEANGSCYGMAGTSRLLEEGSLVPGMFDTPEGDGWHGVLFGSGFPGSATDHREPPKPARWSGFDLFAPHRPLNLWGRITSLAGAQTSAEAMAALLSQIHPPTPFGVRRGLASGDPRGVLRHVEAAPGDYTVCVYRRDWESGHCVTPYAVEHERRLLADALTPADAEGFSLIKVYDNNFPGAERFIEVDRTRNVFRYHTGSTNGPHEGPGLFHTPMSVYRGWRHAPGPDFLGSYGTEFFRWLAVGTESAGLTNAVGATAGWTAEGVTNSYPGALSYMPVGYLPGEPDRFDTKMFFLPVTNAPLGGRFHSRGSQVLLYGALGWSDIAFGFRAPDTAAAGRLYDLRLSADRQLQGLGVQTPAVVRDFSAMVSVRDANEQCQVWLLDAGTDAVTADLHLEHEGFAGLRVRNQSALPLRYRIHLSGVSKEGPSAAEVFEFGSDWTVHPPGATVRFRPLDGSRRGFWREVDLEGDGTPEWVESWPARGVLRPGREGSVLALRWRPWAAGETLEVAEDPFPAAWEPAKVAIQLEGPDRVARVPATARQQIFRLRVDDPFCFAPGEAGGGARPNPWETPAFKFEAFDATGAPLPQNLILTRSGLTGLEVSHTVHLHPQEDAEVLHLDLHQTSGWVVVEAVGPLGTVVSRAERVGPGAEGEVQRLSVRSFRGRIHYVRLLSPNARCLLLNVCLERQAPHTPNEPAPSCTGFEFLQPDFLNSPASFDAITVSTDRGPLTLEPVAGAGVNGLRLQGHTLLQFEPSRGPCRRVTLRLRDPLGGMSLRAFPALDGSGTPAAETITSGISGPQTLVLEGGEAGIRSVTLGPGHDAAHLLEVCCELALPAGPRAATGGMR